MAKEFNGELVAADSRQVYTCLDIGTGKYPSKIPLWGGDVKRQKYYWEIDGVKIWMYDMVDPKTQYSAFDYVKDAMRVVEDISKRELLPIIVGGTGFYLRALIDGFSNLAIPVNQKLRRELEKLNLEKLQNKLRLLSPGIWEELNESDRKNPRRLLRSIECLSMYPYANKPQIPNLKSQNYNILKIGLAAPKPFLYEKINSRVLGWIKEGLIEEALTIHKQGLSFKRMDELGLEFKYLAKYLKGDINKESLIREIQASTRRYAKRQLTWFKKEKDIKWFDVSKNNWDALVEKLVSDWYNNLYDS